MSESELEILSKLKITSLESLKQFLLSKDNTKNHTYISDIPQLCKDEPCILGIDEAGRGPVLGPMVYGISFCPIINKEILVDLGCADSKQLTEEKRDQVFENINKEDNPKNNIGWAIEIISPNLISTQMNRRSKYSLNEISMDSAIQLVNCAISMKVNIAQIYVDTVGPPEKYQEKLKNLFPYYNITVAKKADSTYPIVSAASICAKVTRDHALKVWKFNEGLNIEQKNYGSGYPNDPLTKEFLSNYINPLFGYPRIVRFSWSTAENALKDKSVDVEFDDSNSKPKFNARALTKFFKKTDKDGNEVKELHYFYKDRYLDEVTEF